MSHTETGRTPVFLRIAKDHTCGATLDKELVKSPVLPRINGPDRRLLQNFADGKPGILRFLDLVRLQNRVGGVLHAYLLGKLLALLCPEST